MPFRHTVANANAAGLSVASGPMPYNIPEESTNHVEASLERRNLNADTRLSRCEPVPGHDLLPEIHEAAMPAWRTTDDRGTVRCTCCSTPRIRNDAGFGERSSRPAQEGDASRLTSHGSATPRLTAAHNMAVSSDVDNASGERPETDKHRGKRWFRKLWPFAGASIGLASLGVHVAEFVEALNGV